MHPLPDLWVFLSAVIQGWLTWIGFALMIEPLAESWVPTSWERIKSWHRWDTERRHSVTRAVGVVLVFVACFQAWDEQYSAAHVAPPGGRHLTDEQRSRIRAALKLEASEKYQDVGKYQINSVQECEECAIYAEEIRETINSVPGWRFGGGALLFPADGRPPLVGLTIITRPEESAAPPALKIEKAFADAAIDLPSTLAEDMENGGVIVIVGRRQQ